MALLQEWFTRHDRAIEIGLAALFLGLFTLGAASSLGIVPVASVFYPWHPHQFTVMNGGMVILSLTILVKPKFVRLRWLLLATSIATASASLFIGS